MNAALRLTFLWALLAAIAAALAGYYYPWPQVEQALSKVNSALFERYSANQVRAIEITQFNRDRNSLEQLKLTRVGERWLVPAKGNFPANNTPQIARAIDSLSDRTVLEMMTDNQQEHFDYGVVDPAEYQSTQNRAGLGSKIILEDRNRKTLASLIVGLPVKDDPQHTKRFVRIPGQPHVYVIDFDTTALTTDFNNWVVTNLLHLKTQSNPNGLVVDSISIDNYRIEPDKLAGDDVARKKFYQATIVPQSDRWAITDLKIGSADQWTPSAPTPEQNQTVQSLRHLAKIVVADVKRKETPLAELLRKPDSQTDAVPFDSSIPLGFRKIGSEHSQFQFDATGGQVTVTSKDGVRVTVWIGNIAGQAQTGNGKLNHYVMITAGVDESKLPEPAKPATAEEDPNSVENRDYLRKIEDRKSRVDLARQLASEINWLHADWYYICHEDVIHAIRPELPIRSPASSPASPAEENPSEEPPSGLGPETPAGDQID